MTLFGKKQPLSEAERLVADTRTINELVRRMLLVLDYGTEKGITADMAICVIGCTAEKLIEDLAAVSNRKDAETYVLQKIQGVVEKFRPGGFADKI